MPFCANCGNKVSDNAKFCSICGQKFRPLSSEESLIDEHKIHNTRSIKNTDDYLKEFVPNVLNAKSKSQNNEKLVWEGKVPDDIISNKFTNNEENRKHITVVYWVQLINIIFIILLLVAFNIIAFTYSYDSSVINNMNIDNQIVWINEVFPAILFGISIVILVMTFVFEKSLLRFYDATRFILIIIFLAFNSDSLSLISLVVFLVLDILLFKRIARFVKHEGNNQGIRVEDVKEVSPIKSKDGAGIR